MTRTSRHPGALSALRAGLGAAAARPWLVAMLWSCHLVLGLALAIPMFRWLYAATAYRPAADALAQRFSFGWLVELLRLDGAPVIGILQGGIAGGLLVAVMVSPLLIAATLASLRDGSRGRGEVGATAVALYWPFLRVIVFGRAAALVAGGLTAAVLRVALRGLSDSPWEPGFLWAAAIQLAGAVLVGVLLLAVVDYALVRLEADRLRAGFRAWLGGLRFVLAHPVLTLRLWAGAAVVFALALGVYAALREVTTVGGAALPAEIVVGVTFAFQQIFMLARTWLRVGLLGAEQHVSDRALDASTAYDDGPAVSTIPHPLDAGSHSEATVPHAAEEPR